MNEPVAFTVVSRDGKEKGKVVSFCENRHCGVESCRGHVLCVKWGDGKHTYPCTGGMVQKGNKYFIH